MRANYTQLYVHLIWATWDRMPLVTEDIEPAIYATIAEECRKLKCVPLAIGGTMDHVHLLARLHPSVSVATLAHDVKGGSSHLVTHRFETKAFFKWQGAYGAFTLRKDELDPVRDYVLNQKQHHAASYLIEDWERIHIEVAEKEKLVAEVPSG